MKTKTSKQVVEVPEPQTSKTEWTPGEWQLEENGRACLDITAPDALGYVIARMIPNSPCKEANARLISAAPDLCEALRNLMTWRCEANNSKTTQAMDDRFYQEYLRNGQPGVTKMLWEDAQKALTKAGVEA